MKNLIYAARPIILDFVATLVFVAISAITRDPMIATAVALAAGVGRVIYMLARGQKVAAMTWMSLALVVVAGVASLVTHNPRFMMAKATVVYLMVGGAMMQRGWMLPYMPPAGRGRVPESLMVAWGYAWAALMFFTALLNTGFALWATFAQWSVFVSIFPLVSKVALFAVQFWAIRRVAIRHRRAEVAGQTAQGAPATC
jgi:intracellular septation protein